MDVAEAVDRTGMLRRAAESPGVIKRSRTRFASASQRSVCASGASRRDRHSARDPCHGHRAESEESGGRDGALPPAWIARATEAAARASSAGSAAPAWPSSPLLAQREAVQANHHDRLALLHRLPLQHRGRVPGRRRPVAASAGCRRIVWSLEAE